MLVVLVALLCTALGFFVGVVLVTGGLREDIASLKAERAELREKRAQLDREIRAAAVLLPEPRVMFDLGAHKLTTRALS